MAMIDLSQWQDMPDEHLMVWWFSISRVDLAWSYTLVIYCGTSPSKPSSVTSWWIKLPLLSIMGNPLSLSTIRHPPHFSAVLAQVVDPSTRQLWQNRPSVHFGVLNSLGSQLDLGGKRWKPWEGRLEENHRKSRKLQFWWNFDVNMM